MNPWAGGARLGQELPKTLSILLASWHDLITSWGCEKFIVWLNKALLKPCWGLPLLHALGFVEFPPFQVPLGVRLPPNPCAAAAWEHPVNTKNGIFLQREEFPEKPSPADPHAAPTAPQGGLGASVTPGESGIRNQGSSLPSQPWHVVLWAGYLTVKTYPRAGAIIWFGLK